MGYSRPASHSGTPSAFRCPSRAAAAQVEPRARCAGYMSVALAIYRLRWLYIGCAGYISVALAIYRLRWLYIGCAGCISVALAIYRLRWLYIGCAGYISV
jgi:hypothetical protein